MSSSSTPRSELAGRSSAATPRLWTFASRSRRVSILPRRGSGEWTPTLTLLVLVAALVAQFALPSGTQLPDDAVLAPRRVRDPSPAMVPDYSAVLRAPIFAPDRRPGEAAVISPGLATAPQPQVLGVAASGRSASAVIRGSDGADHVMQPGQALQGWRLLAVTPNGAVFLGPAGRVSLPVGGPPPGVATLPTAPHPGQTTASEPPP